MKRKPMIHCYIIKEIISESSSFPFFDSFPFDRLKTSGIYPPTLPRLRCKYTRRTADPSHSNFGSQFLVKFLKIEHTTPPTTKDSLFEDVSKRVAKRIP